MKVSDIMTADPAFCFAVDSLTKAASIMWQRDCGAVPVLDAGNSVIGMVTDRDICIAAASSDRKASEIMASELCGAGVVSVTPKDQLKKAVKLMRKNQLRRLPVITDDGQLAGIITLADIVSAAGAKKKPKELTYKKVFSLFEAVSKKTPILLSEVPPGEVPEEAVEGKETNIET
jgi:CBS domain-containing protein